MAILLGTLVSRSPAVAEIAWSKLPGAAKDIGVGADGSVWMTGTDDGIYHWDGRTWQKTSGAAVRIAVDPQGTPWVVNAGGDIFRRVGEGWEKAPGAARDIGIGADGSVWVTGTDRGIYRWDGSTWLRDSGLAVDLAVAPNGQPWVVNTAREIFRAGRASAQQPTPSASTSAARPAVPSASPEKTCRDAVQNKVGWNRAGDKSWTATNLTKLCTGVTHVASRVHCFEDQIRQHDDWSRAIGHCNGSAPIPPPAPAPTRVTIQEWVGTAPFCESEPADCTRRGMTYVRSDDAGDGEACFSGTKVLCRGSREQAGPASKDVWIGTAPSCSASPDDCTRLNMSYVRSDRSGNGSSCLTGSKVLCRAPQSSTVREWVGTAPFCSASPDDCTKRRLRFVRRDARGDGDACAKGTKVLCEGQAGDYQPQATGVASTLDEVLSEAEILTKISELERRSRALMGETKWKAELAGNHIQQLIDANPQLLQQVAAASERGDWAQAGRLLQVEALARGLQRPRQRAERSEHRSRIRLAGMQPLQKFASSMLPTQALNTPALKVGWQPGAEPMSLLAPAWREARAAGTGARRSVQVAQTTSAYQTFLLGLITHFGGGIGFIGGFFDQISAMKYPLDFPDGASEQLCRRGWAIPQLGIHLGLVTVGEWTDPYHATAGDFEGFSPGVFVVGGGIFTLWWDYKGNYKGWTLSMGVGAEVAIAYTRQKVEGC